MRIQDVIKDQNKAVQSEELPPHMDVLESVCLQNKGDK